MSSASIRLTEELDQRLGKLAKLTKRSKGFFIKEALVRYIDDMEDVYIALERLADPDATYMTTDRLLGKLDEK